VSRPLAAGLAVALAVTLNACEGTWATPSIFELSPVGHSHIRGLARVDMVCVEVKERVCTTHNTSVELQFQQLHDPGRYGAFIQRGACLQPATVITKISLSATNEPSQGLLGHAFLDLGIHHFLKDGYSIALRNRQGQQVACGDIQSDRFY
jgi:hypothetical protein